MVLTEWDEFKDIDYENAFKNMIKPSWVFDGRGLLDREKIEEIGFKFKSIGTD